MTVLGQYTTGDLVIVMEGEGCDTYPYDIVRVLKDFDDPELRDEFADRYTGPAWDFGYHYYAFLTKRGYIEPVEDAGGVLYL